MGLTTDKNDPRLTHGIDSAPVGQAEVYLVLSEEERASGFVRPVRYGYIHVGRPGPNLPFRVLTDEEKERYAKYDYIWFEEYTEENSSITGRFWTQKMLDAVENGCGSTTIMGIALAETYAHNPSFYGATYCSNCYMHRPVGKDGEFIWEDGSRVGT